MTKLRRTRTATLILCGLAIGSTAAEQQPPAVDISTPDGFTLKATYRPANAPGPPVLLIHQCNTDRHAWDGFATDLSNAGFHVLAPDLCGFGDSRGSDGRVASEQWGGDLDSALIYLLSRPGVDKGPVAVVGASCGVVEASLLATRHREIVALVLMSGFVNLDGKDYISATPSLSIFGAGAEGRQSKYRPRMPCGTDMRRILRSLTVVIPLSAVTYAQGARPGGYVSAGHATDFLQRLQGAIERDDRRAVARMVHYPATVLASGWNIPVKDSTRC